MPITAGMISTLGGATGSHAWEFFGEMLHTNILEEYYPKLLLHDMGQHITLPGNKGKTVHIRSWNKVNPVEEIPVSSQAGVDWTTGAPMLDDAEFTPPSTSAQMSLNTHMGQMHGFGGHFGFSDIFASINEVAETLTVGTRQLGAGYAVRVEDACLVRLLDTADGTAVYDGVTASETPLKFGSGGKAWGAGLVEATDYMTVGDIMKVSALFEGNVDGMTYAFPDGNYRGIIHPYVRHDLFTHIGDNRVNLVDWMQTSRGQGMFEGSRIPVLGNVALETSAYDTTNPWANHLAFDEATWGSNADTYMGATCPFDTNVKGFMSLFFAPGAFSCLDLANATPSLILQPFGSGGATGDPLKRVMSIGIKGYQTWVTHQVDRRLCIVATVSSLTV